MVVAQPTHNAFCNHSTTVCSLISASVQGYNYGVEKMFCAPTEGLLLVKFLSETSLLGS